MKTHGYVLTIVLACQGAFLSGCTTALWEKERFARCHWPANPPNLQLFYSQSARDVLVAYDEQREGDTKIERRAYWAARNRRRIDDERKPSFVSPAKYQNLAEIPLADNGAPPSAWPGQWAVFSTNGLSFTLHLANEGPLVHMLPVYYVGSGQRVKQVLLTPLAVAVDATVVGGVAALILVYVHAESCHDDRHAGSGWCGR
jgi:hypothetical protein